MHFPCPDVIERFSFHLLIMQVVQTADVMKRNVVIVMKFHEFQEKQFGSLLEVILMDILIKDLLRKISSSMFIL
jgi:hypothetical protein